MNLRENNDNMIRHIRNISQPCMLISDLYQSNTRRSNESNDLTKNASRHHLENNKNSIIGLIDKLTHENSKIDINKKKLGEDQVQFTQENLSVLKSALINYSKKKLEFSKNEQAYCDRKGTQFGCNGFVKIANIKGVKPKSTLGNFRVKNGLNSISSSGNSSAGNSLNRNSSGRASNSLDSNSSNPSKIGNFLNLRKKMNYSNKKRYN